MDGIEAAMMPTLISRLLGLLAHAKEKKEKTMVVYEEIAYTYIAKIADTMDPPIRRQ